MNDDFYNLKQFHDRSYELINQALAVEQTNTSNQEAIALYEQGLQFINQALAISVSGSPEHREKAHEMQLKMLKAREHILSRLDVLSRASPVGSSAIEKPALPSKPAPGASVTNDNNSGSVCMLSPFASVAISPVASADTPLQAVVVFTIRTGVQLFSVRGDGQVSVPSYPTQLDIYRYTTSSDKVWLSGDGATNGADKPAGYIQVGHWVYPLQADTTPVLKTSYGAYIFPDYDNPESATGIVLPSDLPAITVDEFETILRRHAHLRLEGEECKPEDIKAGRTFSPSLIGTQPSASASSWGVTTSKHIETGTGYLARGVVYSAGVTSDLIRAGADRLRSKMTQCEQPVQVHPYVQQSAVVAKDVTGKAVKVSGFLASKLGEATMYVGSYMAPHIRNAGTSLLGKEAMDSNQQTMDNLMEVAAGGIKGFSTVFCSLEEAGTTLAKSLANETVKIMDHTQGRNAADLTGNVLSSVGNTTMTAYTLTNLSAKGIAKKVAKDTGKAVVYQYEEEKYKDNTKSDDTDNSQPGKDDRR